MTTLEEIESCPILNFNYWTSQAKMYLAFMVSSERINGRIYPASINGYKNSFRSAMLSRRNQKFLIR